MNDIVDQPQVQVNGVHTSPPEPQLFEVDLESINVDLYRGKYPTPNMFLDELGKIVYNAEIRAYEDRDRLNKAQAMYTAAQVSIQEFDPGFRLECERMADRERQRREQRRAEKEKERSRQASREGSANASGQENGAQVRRSGRNNGQAPELGITDPLLIERRLKRQRSDGAPGDSHASGEDSGDDHNNKRSRMDGILSQPQQEEHDELDVLGPTSSQVRPATVRFAPDANGLLATPTRVNAINGYLSSPQHPYMTPIAEVHSEGRHSLALNDMLNPTTPVQEHPLPSVQSLIASDPINTTPQTPVPFSRLQQYDAPHLTTSPFVDTPSQYQQDPSTRFQPLVPIQSLPEPIPDLSVGPPQTPHRSSIPVTAAADVLATPTPAVAPQNVTQEVPVTEAESTAAVPTDASVMEVEVPRTPSPPPPDFHVDEMLITDLEARYVQKTERFNVEELEQLRATSLNCIWRHRQEWDRDTCVHELFNIIDEFVEEAGLEEAD